MKKLLYGISIVTAIILLDSCSCSCSRGGDAGETETKVEVETEKPHVEESFEISSEGEGQSDTLSVGPVKDSGEDSVKPMVEKKESMELVETGEVTVSKPAAEADSVECDYVEPVRTYEEAQGQDFEADTLICQKVNLEDAENLSYNGTGNCYIVSEAGMYKFEAVKGNSNVPVGKIESVEILWESFGTGVSPEKADLITDAGFNDDCVYFITAAGYKKGNAVIAARDGSGKILWSWHIWMTDRPDEQEYLNDAGFMMDRNLGATSRREKDMESLGLLYQWGRKDPFLGNAASTIEWPDCVASDAASGTIDFATANPATFIMQNGMNGDWLYSEGESPENTRWKSSKSIYDPCPVGYRVPDGGDLGIWATAFESTGYLEDQNKKVVAGFDLGNKGKYPLTEEKKCWYPLSGYIDGKSGKISSLGRYGNYWSCTAKKNKAYALFLYHTGTIAPMMEDSRADAQSIRCVKE